MQNCVSHSSGDHIFRDLLYFFISFFFPFVLSFPLVSSHRHRKVRAPGGVFFFSFSMCVYGSPRLHLLVLLQNCRVPEEGCCPTSVLPPLMFGSLAYFFPSGFPHRQTGGYPPLPPPVLLLKGLIGRPIPLSKIMVGPHSRAPMALGGPQHSACRVIPEAAAKRVHEQFKVAPHWNSSSQWWPGS